MSEEVQAKTWVLDILSNGYRPDFTSLPTAYFEPNNKSALEHIAVVREKVAEWIQEGFVEQLHEPSFCTSPLSVAARYDSATDSIKYRPVLDLSRHVNNFVQTRPVQLDDLPQIADLIEPHDFLTAFDLKNMFFHVRLHPEIRKYFGFSVPDESGNLQFYRFAVMVYGLKSAVHVVTRLILPLKAYIHRLGIRFSIYVDDGRCVSNSADSVFWQQKLVLHIFQLAGWNVNFAKTVSIPSQHLLYQGFITDTILMKYFAPQAKVEMLFSLIRTMLDTAQSESVGVKILALVLGKIISLLISHGRILLVLCRAAQHLLGAHVAKCGWVGSVTLTTQCRAEFTLMLQILYSSNGQFISSPLSGLNIDICQVLQLKAQLLPTSIDLVSSFSEPSQFAAAFHLQIDGNFVYNQDFDSSPPHSILQDAVCELLALRAALTLYSGQFLKYPSHYVFWPTSSHTVVGFINRGSRLPPVQDIVFQIKLLEQQNQITVKPIWHFSTNLQLSLESAALQAAVSTDEWSVDRNCLSLLFQAIGLHPHVDCFAASFNTICPNFFSRTAQDQCSGVNFFMQTLSPNLVYFCCPPVHLIIPCFRRLIASPNIVSYLLIPDWPSASFWPVIFPLHTAVKTVVKFRASFFFANAGTSHVFSPTPNFDMWALLIAP
jgi:hypothetical protein